MVEKECDLDFNYRMALQIPELRTYGKFLRFMIINSTNLWCLRHKKSETIMLNVAATYHSPSLATIPQSLIFAAL